ncbi:MAG: hypothetical protein AAF357_12640, partial [Verrucomicrobiota bacterium]
PGLSVSEYPRLSSQTGGGNYFVEPETFGDPVDQPYRVDTIFPFTWSNEDRNAIASGWLSLQKNGIYEFQCNSFYERNQLRIDGEVVCDFREPLEVKSMELEAGRVTIDVIGFVGSRAALEVEWRPPGQPEFSPIPRELLFHERKGEVLPYLDTDTVQTTGLTVVVKDFISAIYHNGQRIPDEKRTLLLDRFGSTIENIAIEPKPGDWIVFEVAYNPVRHGGARYFALSGFLNGDPHGLFSHPESSSWSHNDNPTLAMKFIRNREHGTARRALPVGRGWDEGDSFIRQYSGPSFPGEAIWGDETSTWLKLLIPEEKKKTAPPEIVAAP